MNVRELLAAKAAAKAKAEGILNSAQSANRKMTDAENEQFDNAAAEVNRCETMIAKLETVNGWNSPTRPAVASQPGNRVEVAATAEYKTAFYAAMRKGAQAAPEFLAALGENSGANGAYLVPVSLDAAIIQKAVAQSCIRQLARVISTANDKDFAQEDGVAAADWVAAGTSSGTTGETTPSFTKVTLSAYKLATLVKVDEELLFDSAFNLEGELADQIGRAFGTKEESAFVAGDGNGKPTGITVSAPNGVHTASPTAITSDELINLYHALNPAYRGNASWVLNDTTALLVRKLKNTVTGDYMWQPGLQAGVPDRLLGRPVYYSAAMPAATASQVAIVFGDIAAAYTIADRVPRTLQRLNELYSAAGQVGFRATQRTDGKVVKTEAVTSLRMSS